jgi:hypothetical protein
MMDESETPKGAPMQQIHSRTNKSVSVDVEVDDVLEHVTDEHLMYELEDRELFEEWPEPVVREFMEVLSDILTLSTELQQILWECRQGLMIGGIRT